MGGHLLEHGQLIKGYTTEKNAPLPGQPLTVYSLSVRQGPQELLPCALCPVHDKILTGLILCRQQELHATPMPAVLKTPSSSTPPDL